MEGHKSGLYPVQLGKKNRRKRRGRGAGRTPGGIREPGASEKERGDIIQVAPGARGPTFLVEGRSDGRQGDGAAQQRGRGARRATRAAERGAREMGVAPGASANRGRRKVRGNRTPGGGCGGSRARICLRCAADLPRTPLRVGWGGWAAAGSAWGHRRGGSNAGGGQ